MTASIRLAKRVADIVACSRSEAEQYIEGGWVRVDGEVIEEPGFRVEAQQVELLPQASLAPAAPVTILLHKPAGLPMIADTDALLQCISADTLIADDRSGLRFLKRHLKGLLATDQIETSSSGLVVLTQDWRIQRKLVDDAAKVEQEYSVDVSGDIIANGLALLNHGLQFNGKPLAPMKVSWQKETRLRFAAKGVQRGQIAFMCEKVGLNVLAIKRLRIGRIPMGALPVGQWRYLLGYERF